MYKLQSRTHQRTCVVLAGGLGLRIRTLTNGLVPKVLVPVNGVPFLEHKLRSLAEMGITDALILTGELGDQVELFVSRHRFSGLHVSCLPDGPTLLGTGGAIARATPSLPNQFWITYGDSLMTTDLAAAESRLTSLQLDAVMTVYKNESDIEPSNVVVSGDLVTEYSKRNHTGQANWIDLGLLFVSQQAFRGAGAGHPVDLAEILQPLIVNRRVLAWSEKSRFWDIGTPEALHATEAWLRSNH